MKTKNKYIKPTSAVVDMPPMTLLAGSLMRSGQTGNSYVYDDEVDPSQAL